MKHGGNNSIPIAPDDVTMYCELNSGASGAAGDWHVVAGLDRYAQLDSRPEPAVADDIIRKQLLTSVTQRLLSHSALSIKTNDQNSNRHVLFRIVQWRKIIKRKSFLFSGVFCSMVRKRWPSHMQRMEMSEKNGLRSGQ